MTKGPRGFTGLSLRIIAAAAVLLGVWGFLAFSPVPLATAQFLLLITVSLIGGIPVPAGVLVAAAPVAFAVGIFYAMNSGSLIDVAASAVLFWTAGTCLVCAARSAAARREKLVRS